MANTSIGEILVGERQGVLGYITWTDGVYVRVTPLKGDPLASFQYHFSEVRAVPEEEAKLLIDGDGSVPQDMIRPQVPWP